MSAGPLILIASGAAIRATRLASRPVSSLVEFGQAPATPGMPSLRPRKGDARMRGMLLGKLQRSRWSGTAFVLSCAGDDRLPRRRARQGSRGSILTVQHLRRTVPCEDLAGAVEHLPWLSAAKPASGVDIRRRGFRGHQGRASAQRRLMTGLAGNLGVRQRFDACQGG